MLYSVTHGGGSNRIYNNVDKITNGTSALFVLALQIRPEARRYLACRHSAQRPQLRPP